MKLSQNENGFAEIIVNDSCEYEEFYSFAKILAQTLEIGYSKKLDDFDSLYWAFVYDKRNNA